MRLLSLRRYTLPLVYSSVADIRSLHERSFGLQILDTTVAC